MVNLNKFHIKAILFHNDPDSKKLVLPRFYTVLQGVSIFAYVLFINNERPTHICPYKYNSDSKIRYIDRRKTPEPIRNTTSRLT